MTARLSGKTALVTGGARGIGAATVRRFVAEGARVAFSDLLDGQGAELAAELGGQAAFFHHDVSNRAAWDKVVADAEARFGPINILVNNAGIAGDATPISDESDERWHRMIAVNQTGVFHGLRAILPSMQRAGGGSIVNVSSIAGLIAWPGLVAYSATKFAVVGMTKTAAAELGRLGIRVNAIHPGIVETAMVTELDATMRGMIDGAVANLPLNRLAQPGELANAILFFASDESSYCTGASLAVDGGWTAL
ncbi:MAG: 3-alpha-(or 20-beta)-hydroxysteroid dehydrogenase [Pseudomonadota bacterium]